MNQILLVCGSRRDGFSHKILMEIHNQIPKFQIIKLKDYHIEYCLGCLSCDKRGECVIQDDLNKIVELINKHDVIVFAIPNYFGGMSGFFKNFMDRLHFMYKRSILKDKKIIFIYTGALEDEQITMEEMRESTKNVEKYLEMSVVQRYSFSSRKELDKNRVTKIIEYLDDSQRQG